MKKPLFFGSINLLYSFDAFRRKNPTLTKVRVQIGFKYYLCGIKIVDSTV